MPLKIAVDNNFFDTFELLAEDEKQRFMTAFKTKALIFYATPELVSELLGLYKTKRRDYLKKYIPYLLSMLSYRLFNPWGEIVRVELGVIKTGRIFSDCAVYERFKQLLIDTVNGTESVNEIESYLSFVQQDKATQYKKFLDNQEHHLKLFKAQNITVPKMEFEEFFQQDFVVKIRRDLIKDLLERGGVQATMSKINRFFNNPSLYPYLHASSRVFMAIFYRHIVRNFRVDPGDSYDQYHLIYSAKVDYLITEDKRLREFGADVYPSPVKVIPLSELMRMI